MENKPIITCHGDQALISKLHPLIKQGLPRDIVEWRRSYGRPVRNIRTDANFVPYKPDLVPNEDNWVLLGRSFFHIYWTECDIDSYKSSVKDEISEWLACLKSRNVSDWLIVIVVNDESKVKTKILRTSVLDKVKNDFCSKQQDRCIVLQEPFKPDSKSSESWSKLFSLMRQHILLSFNTSLNRFEEHMRLQREKRQEDGWTFNNYFLLQEELAFMFEMLGLYEDALVQYDELDALFTQFVLNHAAGDTAEWLQRYTDQTPTRWDSIQLSKPIDFGKRNSIKKCEDSLLDFRNYLFLRQATLLFLLQKPWEVAERVLPFMHNGLHELKLLEIKLPKGGSCCWVFLTCVEIVKACEVYTASNKTVDTYSLYMAVLWDYARKKLHELAGFCGILPSSQKENLSLVVDLIAGFTLDEDTDALIKLREALSSKASFTKHYLELSELAMGTYKHIGRLRSAKLICKDLAEFYIMMGNYQKAEAFLQDALKIYVQEGWPLLSDQIRLGLAQCQKHMEVPEKYVRTCAHLSASSSLPLDKRKYFQEEMIATSKNNTGDIMFIPTKPILWITKLVPQKQSFLVTDESLLNIMVHLAIPEQVYFDSIKVALAFNGTEEEGDSVSDNENNSINSQIYPAHKRNPSEASFGSLQSTGSIDILHPHNASHDKINNSKIPQMINLVEHYDFTPNQKVVLGSSLKSKMNLKRIDSGNKMIVIDKDIDKGDYSKFMQCCTDDGPEESIGVTLLPGDNVLVAKAQLQEYGIYTVTQVCFTLGGVEFLRNIPVEEVSFHVLRHKPNILISPKNDTMHAGVYEEIILELYGGTEGVEDNTQIFITYPSSFLSVRSPAEKIKNRCIDVSPLAPGERKQIVIFLKANLQSLNNGQRSKHQLKVEWNPLDITCETQLEFLQPVVINHHLHTAGKRKFIQCRVQGICDLTFHLFNPVMTCECKDVELLSLNKADKKLEINANETVSYMWELKTNVIGVELVLPCHFATKCIFGSEVEDINSTNENEIQECHYEFSVDNYTTLYSIESLLTSKNESTKNFYLNKEYSFKFNVTSIQSGTLTDIVYVISSPSKQWQLNGQTQGVVKFGGNSFSSSITVVPVCSGYLSHPLVSFYHVKEGWSKAIESNTAQSVPLDIEDLKEQSILITLTKGRVYYASLAQTVHVLNEKDIAHSTPTSLITSSSSKNTLQVVNSGPL